MPNRSLKKAAFCRLLAGHLSRRYLANPVHLADAFNSCFSLADRRFNLLWCTEFANSIARHFSPREYADRQELATWLQQAREIKDLFKHRKSIELSDATYLRLTGRGTSPWPVPYLEHESDLCTLLEVSHQQLQWLTLPHCRRDSQVDHYRRRAIRKKSGAIRWIEEPLPTLKRVQRIIDRHILQAIPLHDAATGFRRGKSAANCAAVHAGQAIVLKMDLQDFFGSISRYRVQALFSQANYPSGVSQQLARLVTAAPVPSSERFEAGTLLDRTRLPQGSPSSPALANAIAFRLDRRLTGLARSLDATYTRYADDLVFSGPAQFARSARRFATSVAAIVLDEGFSVQHRKTKIQTQSGRQSVLGLTVNRKLNTPRDQYDELRAILHNCIQKGWKSQNREGHPLFREHLQGRISYVSKTNSGRGQKLTDLFSRIQW